MYRCSEDYLTKLHEFSEEFEGFGMSFKNKEIENFYLNETQKHDLKKSEIFCIIVTFLYAFFVILQIAEKSFFPFLHICIILGGFVAEVLLFKFSGKYINNPFLYKIFKYLRFFFCYICLMILVVFSYTIERTIMLRIYYMVFMFINVLFKYYIEFDILIIFMILLFNSFVIIYLQFVFNLENYYLAPEFAGNILYYSSLYFLKKNDFIRNKKSFYEIYKNQQYVKYINQLLDVINVNLLCIKDGKILYINKSGLNYFNLSKFNNSFSNTLESKEIDLFIGQDANSFKNIDFKISSFFKHIKLTSANPNFLMYEGLSLKEILNTLTNLNEFNSQSFTQIGYFTHFTNLQFLDVYIRKLMYKEEVIEILLYDISEIKQAEKLKFEQTYKTKILAKIAHEFKTPLITIISMIETIFEKQKKVPSDNSLITLLSHIQNLSNYTIFLISDIIHFVSDSVKGNISMKEINIKEILEFNYKILDTLINCDEYKIDKIRTSILIDETINSVKVVSDENRLKQIILNFISNAIKFTISGYIKITAKFLKEENQIEICVKDSGLGIKDEDQHLILKEINMFNIDQNYNIRGSGIGLSICKSMAVMLNHKIGFQSKYGKGTHFYIRIDIDNNSSRFKKKNTISFFKAIKRNLIELNNPIMENSFNSDSYETSREFNQNEEINTRRLSKGTGNLLLENIVNDNHPTTRRDFDLQITQDLEKFIKRDFTNRTLLTITNKFFSIDSKNNIQNNKFTIVLVDDHKLVRLNTLNLIKTVMSSLKFSNYNIIEACDGIELLNIIRLDKDNNIKCILVDEDMQYMNGSEAVSFLRKLEDAQKIKKYEIVSMTAFEDQEMKNKILRSGVDCIINKPCNKSELIKILNKWILDH